MDNSNIYETLNNWGSRITEALKAALPDEKDFNGNLKSSIGFSINYAGDTIVFELSLADAYKFIDQGRQPGKFPPPDIIKAWIKNKGLQIKPISTLKSLTSNALRLQNPETKINQLAYLIGRKIAKDGIAPTRFYSDTISPEIMIELQNQLALAFKQDVLFSLTIYH